MSPSTPPQAREDAALAIIEADRKRAQRLIRVLRTATGFCHTVCAPNVRALRDEVGPSTRLIACSADAVEEVIETLHTQTPQVHLVVWTRTPERELFALAARITRIACVLAWPEDRPMPRLWELAIPARRLVALNTDPLTVRDFLQCAGAKREWIPRSTADLGTTLEEIEAGIDQLGVAKRTSRRVVGVAHELLMNAMYDAPVDEHGRPRFAHDRTQKIQLDPQDAPRFLLASDGQSLVLQVADRFGGLVRDHVYGSVHRGFRSRDADAKQNEFVNTAHGGAGLGIHKIFLDASASVFDVVAQRSTVVTAVFDLEHSHRELRTAPRSLHFFRRNDSDSWGPYAYER